MRNDLLSIPFSFETDEARYYASLCLENSLRNLNAQINFLLTILGDPEFSTLF